MTEIVSAPRIAPAPSTSARRRAVFAAAIGNGIEWFDFSVYGFVAVHIGAVFFSAGSAATQLLATFAVFGLTFFVRPLGGLFFGPLADRIGRQRVLVMVLGIMATSTALVGLLPGAATIGVLAPVLLVLLRSLQAFSAGGEFGSVSSFLVEYSAPGRRGRGTSWLMFSAIVGFLVAAVIVAILAWTLDAEAMRSWGWRIPFLLAAPLGLIGLYIRLKLEDTPQFQELQAAGEVARAPLAEAFRHRRALLAVAGIAALHGSAFYAVLTFMITYIGTTVGLGATTGLVAAICGGVAALTLIPFVGGLSDRVGRRPILVTASVGFAVAVVPLFALVRTGTVGAIVGLVLLGFLLGTLVSTSIVAMTEVFPVRVRAAGSSLGYTVSLALFGGTAPFVATFLVSATGSTLSPAYYIVFTALLGLAGSLALPAASAADTTSH